MNHCFVEEPRFVYAGAIYKTYIQSNRNTHFCNSMYTYCLRRNMSSINTTDVFIFWYDFTCSANRAMNIGPRNIYLFLFISLFSLGMLIKDHLCIGIS